MRARWLWYPWLWTPSPQMSRLLDKYHNYRGNEKLREEPMAWRAPPVLQHLRQRLRLFARAVRVHICRAMSVL
jgi:hypothetical protein